MDTHLEDILNKFIGKKILIIGDVMLDEYVYGNVSRISPEAPIPVVKFNKSFFNIGGAGNIASNISALGGKAVLFGFVGDDSKAEILKNLCKERNIECFFDKNSMTSFKQRIIGNSQQIVRIDKEDTSEKIFSSETKKLILEKAKQAEIIIISDYEKGAITGDLINLLGNFKKKIIVGPKPKNKELYKGVFLIVPNRKEAFEITGCSDIKEALHKLREEYNSNIIITLSEQGMILYSTKEIQIPTYAKEVYDVSGASDTVLATVSMSIAAGSSLEEAAILGNHSAGIAVGKKGTYSVSLKELKDEITKEGKKIVDFEELKKIIDDAKRKGKKIAWTNGCFDILHTGHVDYLKKAKKQGDVLVVGIDSDDSVKRLKGSGRPINSESERAEIISALEFVDYIIIFPFGVVKDYLAELNPDIYVKGGDYTLDTINQEERRAVESYNGKIIIIPPVPNKSTTKTIEKIKNNYK